MRQKVTFLFILILSVLTNAGILYGQGNALPILNRCIDTSSIIKNTLRTDIVTAKKCAAIFSKEYESDYKKSVFKPITTLIENGKAEQASTLAASLDNLDKHTQNILLARLSILAINFPLAESFYQEQIEKSKDIYDVLEYSQFCRFNNLTEQSIKAGNQALELSNNADQEYLSRLNLAYCYYNNNQVDKALSELNYIAGLKIKHRPKDFNAEINTLKGDIFLQKNEPNVAMQYYNDAKKDYEKLKNYYRQHIQILSRIANIHTINGHPDQAGENLEKAVKLTSNYTNKIDKLTSLSNIYLQWGTILKNTGDYDQAKEKLQNSLQYISTIVKDNHNYAADLAIVETSQASLEIEMKNYLRAEALCADAYGIYNRNKNTHSTEITEGKALLLTTYGDLYAAMGRYNEAEIKYNEALDTYTLLSRRQNKIYQAHKAQVLNSIGMMYENMGDFENSITNYKVAAFNLAQLQENYPIYLSDYANTLTNIGNLYKKYNNSDSALFYYEKGLYIFRHKNILYDIDQVHYSDICSNLALLYQEREKLEIAEQFYEKAYDITKELAAKSDIYKPLWADVMNDYGLYFSIIDECDLAIYYLSQALEIRRKILPDDNISITSTIADNYDNIAYISYKCGKTDDAAKNYEMAKAIRLDLVNENPEQYTDYYISTMQNLASIYRQDSSFNEATTTMEELAETLLELPVFHDDKYNENLAIVKHNTALLYAQNNQLSQAISSMQDAVKYYKILSESDSKKYTPDLISSLTQIGNYYSDTEDYNNSEKNYLEAYSLSKQLYQNGTIAANEVAANLNNLGLLYYKSGKMDKAKQCYIEARKIYTANKPETGDLKTALNAAMTDINIAMYYIYEKNSGIADSDFNNCDNYLKETIKNLELYLFNPDAKYYHDYAQKILNKLIK